MRVVIATPSTGQCKSVFAFSLARLVAYFAQVRVYPEVEEQYLDFDTVEGSGIGSNRDQLVERFLGKDGATHLLFIDEDMQFSPDTLHTLARRRQPIVGCNYRMRFPPADFTALSKDRTHRIVTSKETTGLEECNYLGFGFCLIERKVLEIVQRPRFLGVFDDNHYSTEDSPFFKKCRESGFIPYIDHDASKRIGHRGDLLYRWDEDYSSIGVPDGK